MTSRPLRNSCPRRFWTGLLAGLLLAGALAGFPAAPHAEDALLTGGPLLAALRQGGLVLYMRHGATHAGETDFWQQGGPWDRATLDDCTRQRNLSPAGHAQAEAMGKAIARLDLPWGAVLASPYCRTRQTADLAFGRHEVSWDLFYHQAADAKTPGDGDAIVAAVKRLLGTPPPAGKDTVLVSHGGNLSAAAGVYLAEGETAVFRPGAGGAFTLVARITPEDWNGLAAAANRAAQWNKDAQQRRWIFRQVDQARVDDAHWRRANLR